MPTTPNAAALLARQTISAVAEQFVQFDSGRPRETLICECPLELITVAISER